MSLAEGRLISVVSNEQCSVGTSSNNGSSSVLADWSQAVSLITGKKEKKKRKLIYIWMLNRVDRFVDDVEGINLDSRNIKHHPLTIHKLFHFFSFTFQRWFFQRVSRAKAKVIAFRGMEIYWLVFPTGSAFHSSHKEKRRKTTKSIMKNCFSPTVVAVRMRRDNRENKSQAKKCFAKTKVATLSLLNVKFRWIAETRCQKYQPVFRPTREQSHAKSCINDRRRREQKNLFFSTQLFERKKAFSPFFPSSVFV